MKPYAILHKECKRGAKKVIRKVKKDFRKGAAACFLKYKKDLMTAEGPRLGSGVTSSGDASSSTSLYKKADEDFKKELKKLLEKISQEVTSKRMMEL